MLGKNFSRNIFFLFSKQIGLDIPRELSPKERICMECQSPFSEKNKKHIVSLSSAEINLKVVKVIILRYMDIN